MNLDMDLVRIIRELMPFIEGKNINQAHRIVRKHIKVSKKLFQLTVCELGLIE